MALEHFFTPDREKKKLKIDERPKLKTGNHKTPRRKHR